MLIYTDGSSLGNPGPGGWCAWFPETQEEFSGRVGHCTNNEIEMMAILNALANTPEGETLVIYTDSRNCMGWLSGRMKIDKDNKILRDLKDAITTIARSKNLKVTFRKVDGHSGDKDNDRADAVAHREATICKNFPPEVSTSEHCFNRLKVTMNIKDLSLEGFKKILIDIESLGGEASGVITETDGQNGEHLFSGTIQRNKIAQDR